jgi:hypothetical protein
MTLGRVRTVDNLGFDYQIELIIRAYVGQFAFTSRVPAYND